MPKNRVEELETEVAELQSTVRGLTEELVEAKERIRVLEAELDTDAPTRVPERRSDGTAGDGASEAEPDDVAAATAEADKSDEPQETDEADDSGVDDIIVA